MLSDKYVLNTAIISMRYMHMPWHVGKRNVLFLMNSLSLKMCRHRVLYVKSHQHKNCKGKLWVNCVIFKCHAKYYHFLTYTDCSFSIFTADTCFYAWTCRLLHGLFEKDSLHFDYAKSFIFYSSFSLRYITTVYIDSRHAYMSPVKWSSWLFPWAIRCQHT